MRSPRPTLPEFASDGILVAGGGRAILLQLAHPAVGRGVARQSDFEHRALERLWNTLGFVYAVTFGDDAQRQAAVRAVDRAHRRVRSQPGEHPAYDARDGSLQLWVAATLYETAVTVHERLIGPVAEHDADTFYTAYSELATVLQMPPELWPVDRAAFRDYWEAMLPTLQVDAETREVARRLLFPTSIPAWMRVLMPLARLTTIGLLPPGVRDLYGMRWTPRAGRWLRVALVITRRVWPLLPRVVRELPKRASLRRVDRMLRAPAPRSRPA
ncbi:oxygenase MpaB family protein [Rathayibacter sp. YIM 133350]|uniref:oxygenase MpaB family protein n=1 Tax=Rathayibacter sp. YIM 133350 TaxID=3131992 RepID=UPI00307DBE4A